MFVFLMKVSGEFVHMSCHTLCVHVHVKKTKFKRLSNVLSHDLLFDEGAGAAETMLTHGHLGKSFNLLQFSP